MRPFDLSRLVLPVVYLGVAGLIGLFVYSGLWSDRGTEALKAAEAERARLNAELSVIQSERARVENKVRRLTRAYLDLDLLDERARTVLGYVRTDDVVIEPVAR
ncbi:MAG: septum formation initiator family protein [Pseudomonadota bacterium]